MAEYHPYFDHSSPPEERTVKHHVWLQIYALRQHLENFQAAAALIDHCEATLETMAVEQSAPHDDFRQVMDWERIAARDAVMTVYHFGVTVMAIRSNIGKAPSLKRVDHKLMRGAWKRFLRAFPFYEEHRHAVAHLADDMRTIEKLEALIPEDGAIQTGNLDGRTYIMNYKKGRMALSVTAETATELQSIMYEVWGAFRPMRDAELEAIRQRAADRKARRSQGDHQNPKDQGEP